MTDDRAIFRTIRVSPQRLAIIDSLRAAKRKPAIHLFAELDVAGARQALQAHAAQTGQRLSFTAYLVYCVARAVDEDKSMHAYRRGRRLVIFDEVDVCVLVEHDVGSEKVAAPHVIRAANRKSLLEIHDEIRAAQKGGAGDAESWRHIRFYPWIPGFLRRLFWHLLFTRPGLMKRTAGTVCVTAAGMFASGADFGIPISGYTLALTVGGIGKRSEIVDGQPQQREFLTLTVSADHEVIDGALLARFMGRFRKWIESAGEILGSS